MIPKTLKPGDKIGLMAPARAVNPQEMEPFINLAQSWGLEVVLGKNLYKKHHIFSATDEQRAQDFIDLWTDPSVKAIICARGGYGSMRLLKHIPKEIFNKGQKWLIGYSDITTLHLHLNALNIASIHGPMAINAGWSNRFINSNFSALHHLLFSAKVSINCSKCRIENLAAFSGELIGGNVSLVYASLGTPEQPKTDGKVLFLEEIDEYLYHLDRMVVSMDRAGLFKNLAGLVIGSLIKMKDNKSPFGPKAEEIIAESALKYGYPIIYNFPAGHGAKNSSITMGSLCNFDGKLFTQNLL
jgi:muramoyltetrapeptide carboxypeptidase